MSITPARLALATVTAVCTIAAGGILLHAHLNGGDSHAPVVSAAPVAQPDTRTVTVYVDRPVVEYRDRVVVETETVYVDVPGPVVERVVEIPAQPELDPVTGLPVTAQLMLDRENAGYESGFSDGTDAAINRLFDALNVPCETEDSEECYWDAATHGNGEGRPFVNINGRVVYLDFQ